MKILTWNIESPAITAKKRIEIIRLLKELNADLIILTETNDSIKLDAEYAVYSTPFLKSIAFGVRTNRTTIYSKYKVLQNVGVSDADTCLCYEVETPIGNLCVYGTIIGNLGGKGEQFKIPFLQQLDEYKDLLKKHSLCIAGDLNINFTGYAYPSKDAIEKMMQFCKENELKILTSGIENCVDHIILSEQFTRHKNIQVKSWNHDRLLSDHIGVMIEIN